jgi:hypothetical protein
MVRFEIRIPDGDDGTSLGVCTAEAIPRVGDAFVLYHPRVCPDPTTPFEGKVDAVVWEARKLTIATASAREIVADLPMVWIAENAGMVKLYCECTDAERAEKQTRHLCDPDFADSNGVCFNCGDERPPRREMPF